MANSQEKKVLIIEDDAMMAFALKRTLEVKKYEVRILESLEEIATIKDNAPHLIFLDISLWGTDGAEIAQELKRNERTKDIPIIILTGYADADQLAKKAGADNYLTKPFELKALWEITEKYMK